MGIEVLSWLREGRPEEAFLSRRELEAFIHSSEGSVYSNFAPLRLLADLVIYLGPSGYIAWGRGGRGLWHGRARAGAVGQIGRRKFDGTHDQKLDFIGGRTFGPGGGLSGQGKNPGAGFVAAPFLNCFAFELGFVRNKPCSLQP